MDQMSSDQKLWHSQKAFASFRSTFIEQRDLPFIRIIKKQSHN